MKKLATFILVFAALLTFTAIAATKPAHVYSPESILYLSSPIVSSYDIVTKDGERCIEFVLEPGSYVNSQKLIKFAYPELNVYEYPFVRIEYRTDSPSKKFDFTVRTTAGESWPSAHPQMTASEDEWKSLIFDIGTVTGGATPDKTQKGSAIVLKPWNSGTQSFDTRTYFDIRYIAFFKTQAEAERYEYSSGDDEHGYVYEEGLVKDAGKVLDKLNAEFDARVEEIKESESTLEVTGKKYYVSERGSDNNDGLSEKTPWKTIKRVNEAELCEGDGVFFKRGDHFRANGHSLKLKSGVTYSAYGKGDKPVLVGSISASSEKCWEETDAPNIYRYINRVDDPGCIVFDGGKAWGIKMTANAGVSVDNGVVHNGIDTPFASGGKEFTSYKSLENNLEFIDIGGTLYLYSKDGNPGRVFESVEIMPDLTGVGAGSIKNAVFDNIKLFGYGHHGLTCGSVEGFTVQNCIFAWIGGSDHRLGNAIENWGSANGFTVDNCWFYQIYDCCYTTQITGATSEVHIYDVEFKNNVSEYANSGPEIWGNGKNSENSLINYHSVSVYNNYVRNNGYGWSHQRPNKDSNFYYGALEAPGHNWGDFKVYDNKFFIASKYGLKSRYISENNAHFNGNLYVLGNDKYFARTSAAPSAPGTIDVNYAYNAAMLSILRSHGVENDGEFYSVPAGYTPEPFDYVSANDIYRNDGFVDISGHWAERDILKAVNRGYFGGISDFEFAPEGSMTRAMLFTVLARYAGAKLETGDVWYDGALSWAVENGYTDETNARPDAPITRGELAVVLHRYFTDRYIEPTGEKTSFADALSFERAIYEHSDFDISELESAIEYCTMGKIISGYDDGSFKANAKCTRAQLATIMMRFDTLAQNSELDTEKAIADGRMIYASASELAEKLYDSRSSSSMSLESENGVDFVRVVPTKSSGTVMICLAQTRFDGLDIYKHKYFKVKFRLGCESTQKVRSLDIGLLWTNGEQWLATSDRPAIPESGVWYTGMVCYDQYTESSSKLPYASNHSYYYSIKPWGNNITFYEGNYFDIEAVAFFDDETLASNFEF